MLKNLLMDPVVSASIAKLTVAALASILSVVATFAGRWINAQLHSENSTWKQKLAYRLVCYAEKQFGDNDQRRTYVATQLATLLHIDPAEANHLLEEALITLETTQAATPVVPVTPPPEKPKA